MIRIIKIGDAIYTGIDTQVADPDGGVMDNPIIPKDVETLRAVVLDTLSWEIGDAIKKATGDYVKMSAANSKAIALLAKLVAPLVDTKRLTKNEKSAFDKTVALGKSGYADSELLNASLDAVVTTIQSYGAKMVAASKAKTRDELIAILEDGK